jgi:hypothetical protein
MLQSKEFLKKNTQTVGNDGISLKPNLSMNQTSSKEETLSSAPNVKITRWRHEEYAFFAYQLPSGELVMSDKQISAPVRQSRKEAIEFIQSHGLENICVRIPNKQIITAYPLSTVAIYWKYLQGNQLITAKNRQQYNWEKIIEALQDAKQNLEQASTDSSIRSYQNNSSVIPASSLTINLEKDWQIEVLVLQNNECYISHEAGLSLIGIFPNWFKELPNTPKTLTKLKKKGFNGTSKLCLVDRHFKQEIVESLSYDDWLVIWGLFASYSNTKATAVLTACGKKTIPMRVESVSKPF